LLWRDVMQRWRVPAMFRQVALLPYLGQDRKSHENSRGKLKGREWRERTASQRDTVEPGKGRCRNNQKKLSGRKLGEAIRKVQRETGTGWSKCAKGRKGNRRNGG